MGAAGQERMRDERSRRDGGAASGWVDGFDTDGLAAADILVVEDDDDIRDLLVTLLELAGYNVTACASAERALDALRQDTFDFVLTDYALPNRTGGWLLQQAESEGLLSSTPALVVTAHPSPADVDGFEVVRKPFDLDDLIGRVRQRLGGSDTGGPARRSVAPQAPTPGSGRQAGGRPVVELVLYVSAESPRSANAISNIRNVLSRYRSDKVRLTICDLSTNPGLGVEDRIAFTPTLVKRSPGPRTFILGHIANPEVLVELLDGCEFER